MIAQAYLTEGEINGKTVLAFMNSVRLLKPKILQILVRVGINTPTPFQWYPLQKWVNVFKILEDEIGSLVFFQIGKGIAENMPFSRDTQNIQAALQALNTIHQLNHRGREVGYYQYTAISERRAALECKTPYPSDFDRGMIAGVAKKYAPDGTLVSVALDETWLTREHGEESCTFIVKW